MKKIVLLILIGLLIGTSSAEIKRYSIPLDESPSLGPKAAPVTIVEFIDYQ
ncbi:MAG: hypothetical protein ACLPN1_17015 [Dissulfurispiraceae bacterium]